MRRVKVLSTLCLGACIPILLGIIKELVFPYPWPTPRQAWASRVLLGTTLVFLLLTMVLAYRVVRHSKLPRVSILFVMVACIWVIALLNHFL